MIDTATDPWGIDIERVEVMIQMPCGSIKKKCPYRNQTCQVHLCSLLPCLFLKVKDVRLPQNLQRAMAAEAEATREARAKVTIILCFVIKDGHYWPNPALNLITVQLTIIFR